MKIILASTSVYRKQLLERLNIRFSCQAPDCDEETLKRSLHQQSKSPRQIASALARAKAESIAKQEPDALIIGSDQVAHFAGEIMDKPGSIENACTQLERLNGQQHELLTAVCIIAHGSYEEHLDCTSLNMAVHSPEALRAYTERDQATDCAGAYKLEAGGIALFESIQSADQSAITGLPLLYVAAVLRKHGLEIPGC